MNKTIKIDDIEYDLVPKPKRKPQKEEFRTGDCVIYDNKVYFVRCVYCHEIYGDIYYVRGLDGTLTNITEPQKMRRWTIKDAKDGDVLFSAVTIFIYAGVDKEDKYGGSSDAYIYHIALSSGTDLKLNEGIGVGGIHDYVSARPATLEERRLLFLTLSCYGYEWDAEKKELKKIVKRNCIQCPFNETIELKK